MSIEAGALLVSILSVIVAVVALIRTRKINERLIDLQQPQSALAEYELKTRGLEEQAQIRGNISVSLYESAHRRYRFRIQNTGCVPVSGVSVEIKPKQGEGKPYIPSEFDEIFPVPQLHPGDEVTLIAPLSSDTGTHFQCSLVWLDAEGKEQTKEQHVSL